MTCNFLKYNKTNQSNMNNISRRKIINKFTQEYLVKVLIKNTKISIC